MADTTDQAVLDISQGADPGQEATAETTPVTPAPLVSPAPIPASTPTPDYKALYETEKAGRSQLQQELAAARSVNGTQADQGLLYELRDRLEALETSNSVIAKGVASGETADLDENLKRIAQQRQGTTAQRDYQIQYAAAWGELQDAVKDADGKPLLDLTQAPELEEMRRLWNAAHSVQNIAGLERAVRLALKAGRAKERAAAAAALKATTEKSSKEVKDKLEKAGAFDLDTGTGAPVARITADNIDALYLQGKVTDSAYAKFLNTGQLS